MFILPEKCSSKPSANMHVRWCLVFDEERSSLIDIASFPGKLQIRLMLMLSFDELLPSRIDLGNDQRSPNLRYNRLSLTQ